jgi:hypothetical protein
LTFFEELLLSSLKAESYKMGSDEGMGAVQHEYLERERRELDPLPSLM